MSFRFSGCVVSLNNYASIFKGCDMDFIDEIRLAILDDTPIGDYLATLFKDKDGAKKLAQIRKSLRDYVPLQYISTSLSPDLMNAIRCLYLSGGEDALLQISPYMSTDGVQELPDSTLIKIMTAVREGADITQVNFMNVENDNVPVVVAGLIKGYPMWLIAEQSITSELMLVLMRGMGIGIDVHPFLIGDWNIENIEYLFSQSRKVNLPEILENVNCNFNLEQLKEVISASLSNVDFGLLCLKEDGGQPVFNEYQMEIIRKALINDVLTPEIYDYTKSDMEMQDLFELEMSKKRPKRLSGSLKKH